MNKSVYLALIGATAAQKSPFTKHREAHFHKRRLQEIWEEGEMEGIDWDVAAWEEGEPMEWETTAMEWDEPMDWEEGEWDEPMMEPMYLDYYLAKVGEDIGDYFETYPQYNVFFDLETMQNTEGEKAVIDGWFNVVHDENYSKLESCKTSVLIDMWTGIPYGVEVLDHEWNFECSFEGQTLNWMPSGDGDDVNGLLVINGDVYNLYEYDDIYNMSEWEDYPSNEYQEFYLSPQGTDLADMFDTYPQYSVFSNSIDTTTDPTSASYQLWIYHDMFGEKMEICYLTANLDSNMAPSEGLTVVENEFSYDCSLKDGELINYAPPEMDPPTTGGTVTISGTVFDLYPWEALEDIYYAYEESWCEKNPEICEDYYSEDYWEDDMEDWDMEDWDMEDWEDEWAYDYDDWEYDYDYAMNDYGYYDYDYGYGEEWDYGYDYGMEDWDYYGYGETYYYMDGPERGPDGIMEQITGWFSGDASNKLLTAIASIATIAAMQI